MVRSRHDYIFRLCQHRPRVCVCVRLCRCIKYTAITPPRPLSSPRYNRALHNLRAVYLPCQRRRCVQARRWIRETMPDVGLFSTDLPTPYSRRAYHPGGGSVRAADKSGLLCIFVTRQRWNVYVSLKTTAIRENDDNERTKRLEMPLSVRNDVIDVTDAVDHTDGDVIR
ncbi:hypothetical protein Bbelb_191760 [Branchiostoma belcheri]|nr:hypothetical protein Bbelb_191760 [Branchiostoma belcheri]